MRKSTRVGAAVAAVTSLLAFVTARPSAPAITEKIAVRTLSHAADLIEYAEGQLRMKRPHLALWPAQLGLEVVSTADELLEQDGFANKQELRGFANRFRKELIGILGTAVKGGGGLLGQGGGSGVVQPKIGGGGGGSTHRGIQELEKFAKSKDRLQPEKLLEMGETLLQQHELREREFAEQLEKLVPKLKELEKPGGGVIR